jgi:ADP-ribose pyrophosphatase
MSSKPAPDPLPAFPDLALELVDDLSPRTDDGFLRLVRRRLRVRFPDASLSAPFIYDEIDRRALDAVVIAPYYDRQGERHVYLRSALRPPFYFRDPSRSPVAETGRGALWELPAGLIEPNEQTPEGVFEAGRRELEEELGFSATVADFARLGPPTLPSPGVISERHFFVAIRVRPEARGEPSLDGSALERFGEVIAMPLRRALAACRAGQIEDAKTELGLRRLAEISERSDE